ncbi:MAG: hypothetical protein RSA10_01900 [Bacilli bacterium]
MNKKSEKYYLELVKQYVNANKLLITETEVMNHYLDKVLEWNAKTEVMKKYAVLFDKMNFPKGYVLEGEKEDLSANDIEQFGLPVARVSQSQKHGIKAYYDEDVNAGTIVEPVEIESTVTYLNHPERLELIINEIKNGNSFAIGACGLKSDTRSIEKITEICKFRENVESALNVDVEEHYQEYNNGFSCALKLSKKSN